MSHPTSNESRDLSEINQSQAVSLCHSPSSEDLGLFREGSSDVWIDCELTEQRLFLDTERQTKLNISKHG